MAVNFFNILGNDCHLKIIANLPSGQLQYASLSTVCRNWNELLKRNPFWEPVLRDLMPRTYQMPQNDAGLVYKSLVKTFFVQNCENTNLIANLIKDDTQLAECLGTDQWTLNEFKSKSFLEKARLLWKAMYQDATPVLVALLEGYLPALEVYITSATDLEKNAILDLFNNKEKFTPTVVELIQTHKVSLGKPEDVIYVLLPLVYFGCPRAVNLISSIIKSQADLSKLKQKVFHPAYGTPRLASQVLSSILSPEMQITHEDLIACKLIEPND